MRVPLDHCIPKPFRRELTGHQVRTAFEMGWSSLSNGELLREAARHFDAFLTVDQNLQYQQNLARLPLPVLLLVAAETDPDALRPYARHVLKALEAITTPTLWRIHADGQVDEISSPP